MIQSIRKKSRQLTSCKKVKNFWQQIVLPVFLSSIDRGCLFWLVFAFHPSQASFFSQPFFENPRKNGVPLRLRFSERRKNEQEYYSHNQSQITAESVK